MTVQAAKAKNMAEYPWRPTVGRKVAAVPEEMTRLMSSAMLMQLERMRVGMSSESASQTHTPGPTAKNDMKIKRQIAVSQPFCSSGTGVMSAFSIFNGAVRAASRLANGFEKKATTL